MVSRRNHASLQPCCKINVAVAMIALLVAWLLRVLAIYNSMGLAFQFDYFRLVRRKILHSVGCMLCMHRCPHWDMASSGQFIVR